MKNCRMRSVTLDKIIPENFPEHLKDTNTQI